MLLYSQNAGLGVSMTSIGERLRRQRLQNRISLEKVSLETKIGVRLLEAIEAEQFEKLPGGVFRKSFVLQYAQALGIDPEEIAGELKHLHQFDEMPVIPPEMINDEPNRSGFSFRGNMSGLSGSTIGSLIAAVGVMMACALIYSWWQTPRSKADSASVLPSPHTAAARAPSAPPAAPQTAPPATAPAATAPAPKAPAPTTPGPEATPAAAQPTPASTALVRVGLSADEKTWISISTDGKNVFADSLEPHETKTVEASSRVRILIGNAGGLEISLNGRPIGPVGSRGQVCVVELTPAGFQIVPRKPPALEPL
jgi:cytoskeleton protein RodZ